MTRSVPRFLIAILILGAVHGAAPRLRADAAELQGIGDLPRRARLALFKSRQSAQAENWTEAVEKLEEFIAGNPDADHYLLRYQLGGFLLKNDRPEAAREAFRAATRLEARHAESWLSLGEQSYQLGDYKEAADAIHKGYELSPSHPAHLLFYAAAARLLAGDSRAALPLLEELVYERSELPRLEWYRALIAACADTREDERGRRAITRLLEHHAGQAEAWELAYQFQAGAGNYQAAAVSLTVLGYLRPLSESESVQLGNLFSAIGTPLLAAVRYEAALGSEAEALDFERLASAYLAAHDRESALRTLRLALAERSSVQLWSLLGDLHYMEENYTEARQAYAKCCELDDEQGRSWLMRGYCAMADNEPAAALPLLERAVCFPEQVEAAGRLLVRLRGETP